MKPQIAQIEQWFQHVFQYLLDHSVTDCRNSYLTIQIDFPPDGQKKGILLPDADAARIAEIPFIVSCTAPTSTYSKIRYSAAGRRSHNPHKLKGSGLLFLLFPFCNFGLFGFFLFLSFVLDLSTLLIAHVIPPC